MGGASKDGAGGMGSSCVMRVGLSCGVSRSLSGAAELKTSRSDRRSAGRGGGEGGGLPMVGQMPKVSESHSLVMA